MFKIKFLLIIPFAVFIATSPILAQNYRVFLKDKGPNEFFEGSELYIETLNQFSQQALERRKKEYGQESQILFYEDAPLYSPYIDEIEQFAKIKLKLRWRNYLVVETGFIDNIIDFPFVDSVQTIEQKFIAKFNSINEVQEFDPIIDDLEGFSKRPLQILNVDKLHKIGLDGDGVIIGVLDSGFDTESNDALRNIEVLETYDFIQNDVNTADETGDAINQENHGTAVLSLIAAYDPGNLLGVAPKAKFLLAKTEDIGSETRIEEDNFAAAVEWIERNGAQILNASLSYLYYDPGHEQYDLSEIDGRSSIAAQAINMASDHGVLCVLSAGNSGPNMRTIGTPADSPKAITVGAMKGDSLILADFSSRGPNALGEIKPDIIAPGFKIIAAGNKNNLIFDSGTSFSSPLIAGSLSLILQLNDDKTRDEYIELLYKSTNNEIKDEESGFGLPNFQSISRNIDYQITSVNHFNFQNNIRIFTYTNENIHNLYIEYFDLKSSTTIKKQFLPGIAPNQFYVDISPESIENAQAFEFKILADYGNRGIYAMNDSIFTINTEKTYISPVIKQSDYPLISEKIQLILTPQIITTKNTYIDIKIPAEYKFNSTLYKVEIFDQIGKLVEERTLQLHNLDFDNTFIYELDYLNSGKYYFNFSEIDSHPGNEPLIGEFIVIH